MPTKTLSHAEASLLCFESDALQLQKKNKFFILANRSYRGKYSLLILIFGQCNLASLVSREVVRRCMWRVVEVIKRIADWVPEGVVDGATALVSDGAFVERDRF
ncbi:hypothetical protein CMV_018840 [Castanea mollissima]|uniref:Uncharacterized protein n=1 Tax=Castanea mollissima TaxID=60419 RepID=A0A8J4R078_9ROSI|nr:hypothetical protein CMV_018840 [Castanea mollissima]